ncbi:hypothetical protein PHYBOEH_001449 [Phytophthora boehmeriae]|uniref:Elicitor-like transglutaminase n=1 Tax=Phytophthora boehmeriae TaxID=109152 RepID=A0A8T1WZ55_9STRA|nr:hypothetical protein PHYBOEH_001449 [Phytophthora boehmeriae]
MVKAVRSISLRVIIAAALAATIQATGIAYNPTTNTEVDAPLDPCHPAYGGPFDPACVVVDVPYNADDEKAESLEIPSNGGTTRRMEDAANKDVSNLETYLGESLELSFTVLKEEYASGEAPIIPWPGSYWPTYQDSINVQWKAGEDSPSSKYAQAFGLDPTEFMNNISAKNGIDSQKKRPVCSVDADCKSLNDESVCGRRAGAPTGYCIPTWYGICHAWAPAALMEEEPQCDVVKNGVTFHVMDIKALISDIYDGSSIKTVFTGSRFNGPDNPPDMDQYGRYRNPSRRDLGAGFFHLAISNLLGKHNKSFILDVSSTSAVWNQPVRSYKVESMELVDPAQASMQHFGTETYPFNSEMVNLAYVKTTVSWVVEAYADGPLVSTGKVDKYTVSDVYEYLLELDANYAVIGGEWVGRSKTDHADFLWFATAKPDASSITSTGLNYANVEELLNLSVACGAPEKAQYFSKHVDRCLDLCLDGYFSERFNRYIGERFSECLSLPFGKRLDWYIGERFSECLSLPFSKRLDWYIGERFSECLYVE